MSKTSVCCKLVLIFRSWMKSLNTKLHLFASAKSSHSQLWVTEAVIVNSLCLYNMGSELSSLPTCYLVCCSCSRNVSPGCVQSSYREISNLLKVLALKLTLQWIFCCWQIRSNVYNLVDFTEPLPPQLRRFLLFCGFGCVFLIKACWKYMSH